MTTKSSVSSLTPMLATWQLKPAGQPVIEARLYQGCSSSAARILLEDARAIASSSSAVEQVDHPPAHALDVDRRRRLERCRSRLSVSTASITRRSCRSRALDEPGRDEPVESAREAARRELQRARRDRTSASSGRRPRTGRRAPGSRRASGRWSEVGLERRHRGRRRSRRSCATRHLGSSSQRVAVGAAIRAMGRLYLLRRTIATTNVASTTKSCYPRRGQPMTARP